MNKKVLHTGIDLLSRREHSIKELQQKLQIREYEGEDIAEVISFLLANDYLSEERYAESIFRNRVRKGYGAKFIEQELALKGVDYSIFAAVAEEQAVDWQLQAAKAYEKKYGDTPIADQKNKAKRVRFLQHRGFSMHDIYPLIND